MARIMRLRYLLTGSEWLHQSTNRNPQKQKLKEQTVFDAAVKAWAMLPTNIATPGNPKISQDNRIEWTLSFPYETIPTAR